MDSIPKVMDFVINERYVFFPNTRHQIPTLNISFFRQSVGRERQNTTDYRNPDYDVFRSDTYENTVKNIYTFIYETNNNKIINLDFTKEDENFQLDNNHQIFGKQKTDTIVGFF